MVDVGKDCLTKLTKSSKLADMIKSTNNPLDNAMAPFIARGRIGLLLLCLLMAGCGGEARQPVAETEAATTTNVAGFAIPLFPTATEQLNYAKSLSANPLERSAALNLIIGRFPDDRQELGETRLELAYLHLGSDFRLAGEQAYHRALTAYEAVARQFSDLPAIRAKAYWYMAWIYTDLLEDKSKGLALYALLAEKHPQDSFSRIFPVPWLKLVFPDPNIGPYTADDRHSHSWAGLALLEIVRNADDPETQTQAFQKLWREHRHSLTTGYALKAILRNRTRMEPIAPIVEAYVKDNTVNAALNHDLLALLQRRRTGETAN